MGLLNPHLEDDDFADVWSARTAGGAPIRTTPRKATCASAPSAGPLHLVRQLAGRDSRRRPAETDESLQPRATSPPSSSDLPAARGLEHPARVIAFPSSPARWPFRPPAAADGRLWPRPSASSPASAWVSCSSSARAAPADPVGQRMARATRQSNRARGQSISGRQRRGVHRAGIHVFAGQGPRIPRVPERDHARRPRFRPAVTRGLRYSGRWPLPLIFRKGLDMKEAVAGELAAAYDSAVVDQVRARRLSIHRRPAHRAPRPRVRLLLRRRSRGRLRLPGAAAVPRPERLPDRRDHPQPARQRSAARDGHPVPPIRASARGPRSAGRRRDPAGVRGDGRRTWRGWPSRAARSSTRPAGRC